MRKNLMGKKMHKRSCKICGEAVLRRRRFCFKHILEKEEEKRLKNKPKICPTCHDKFSKKHHGFRIQKYCSWRCSSASLKTKKASRKGIKKLELNKRLYAEILIARSLNHVRTIKLHPAKTLKAKLDRYCSQLVRYSAVDSFGLVKCYTCEKREEPKKMDCGHYVSRRITSLRWDLRNVHPQCKSCNMYRHGAMDSYALKLQQEYGPNILVDLNKEKTKTQKITIEFFSNTLLLLYLKAKEYKLEKKIFALSDMFYATDWARRKSGLGMNSIN